MKVRNDIDFEQFNIAKNELFHDLSILFKDFCDCELDLQFRHILIKIFDKFFQVINTFYNFNNAFEFSLTEFEIFNNLNLNQNQWIKIYGLLKSVIEFYEKNIRNDCYPFLDFLKLFYLDLMTAGPFSEDIFCLDMSDELYELLTSESKNLYDCFNVFLKSENQSCLDKLIEISKMDSIPFFMVFQLTSMINDCTTLTYDDEGFTKKNMELFITAINKHFSWQVLNDSDLMDEKRAVREIKQAALDEKIIEDLFSKVQWWSDAIG